MSDLKLEHDILLRYGSHQQRSQLTEYLSLLRDAGVIEVKLSPYRLRFRTPELAAEFSDPNISSVAYDLVYLQEEL